MRISGKYYVVIPVHNEEKNIERCLAGVREYCPNIIVVDDGSDDNTSLLVSKVKNVQLITLPRNRGKGFAMRAGAQKAWRLGARGVIFMDGDNQHNPKHLPEFLRKMQYGNDIIIGIRLLKTEIPFYRKLGNYIMSYAMRSLFNISIKDMMCGYRALTRKGYVSVKWSSDSYGVETEMLTIIGRKNLPFRTVVVDTIYHDKYKGFSIRDGIKIIQTLPYFKMREL